MVLFTDDDDDDGYDYAYGNGKWYSFFLERVLWINNWVNAKTWLSISNNNLTKLKATA
jgi:hypothetical protein